MKSYYFEYDRQQRILAVRFTGTLTDEIFEEYYAVARGYVEAHDVAVAMMDLGELTAFDVRPQTARKIGRLAALIPDPTPRFIIAPQDVAFGMARLFQSSSPEGRSALYVVRSAQLAYVQAGISAPQFERLP